MESRIAPLCPLRSYPRAFRGWNSFRPLISSRAKCRGENVRLCERANVWKGMALIGVTGAWRAAWCRPIVHMPSVMDYVTGLTKVGLKIRRRAHLFRGPSPTRLQPFARVLFYPLLYLLCEIARSNRVCMEIEYKLLETQSQFPVIIRHLCKRLFFVFSGKSNTFYIIRALDEFWIPDLIRWEKEVSLYSSYIFIVSFGRIN